MKQLIVSLSALVLLPPAPPRIPASSGSFSLASSADPARVPIPFTSNGCSGFREKMFFSCCFVHDFAYWSGGTWSDRRRADHGLRQCLADVSHNQPLAFVGYTLIRMTTLTGEMFTFGWGRGWGHSDRSFYAPITAVQQERIDDERQRVCRGMTLNPQTQRYYVDETGPRDDIRQVRPAQMRQLCGGELK